jgi:hypothetical protein
MLIPVELQHQKYYRETIKLQFIYFNYICNISFIMTDLNNINRKLKYQRNTKIDSKNAER